MSQPVAPSSEETATAAPAAPAASAPAGTSTVEPRPAVRVENVSVTYRTTFERTPTFKQAIVRFGRGERAVREVHAVKDVSFDVPEGTSLGIIGANGAGKSTLIRTIGGILPPTSGRIEVHGRISALLALGVGFNPNLSGRENVVLGGLANGLTRAQVSARAEEIADFSELGDFMDLPIRTYSSGMRSKLAFAVSVHMDPDILMIDEALSAGDAAFKKKAADKMAELMKSARAMFLVSHGLGSIKEMCNRAIWLHKGSLMLEGTPDEVIAAYTKFLKVGEDAFSLEDL
ncbi:ABC transporter ATP-binding protein [Knoellia sp. LjRoot47]|uniref:ABC transporter ATP-binding protein n=1 Tax=Knoellia sp. LjRoot47 TaxID=3342330 RepID=UPI003ECD5C10